MKAFTDSLNDESDVEIIAIDIDYDSSGDLNSLFATTTLNGKSVPFLTSLYTYSALNDLHQQNEYHLIVGINASFTYSPAQAISAVNNLLSSDMIIVQAAPNVSSSGVDWGQYLSNVINVGAWNVDSNKYVLASNLDAIDTVDVFANGYIQRPGWGSGWNFGTSFATPRVFGDIVNLFDSSVLPLLDSGAQAPDPSTNLSQAEETTITNAIISAISSKYLVNLTGISTPLGPLNVSSKTVNDFGAQPVVVPINASDFGYKLTSAQQLINSTPTGSVTVTGTAKQGETLTVSNSISDNDGVGTITYRWYASGSNASIATGTSYTLTRAEVGKKIKVDASYTDGHGTLEVVSSIETSAVATNNKIPTGAVTITGTAKQGQKLSVANTIKDADGLGAISYQWKADGTAINGATATSLTLTQSQVGKAISVTASYVDKQGNDEVVSSNATTSVVNLNDLPTGSVTITGTAAQGQTLTASNTLADADGLGDITYTWMSGKTVLGTGSTYSLAQSHVGQAITVVARYVDVLGTSESKISAATAKVANVNDAPTVANPIADQTATEGVAFNFTLPTNVFTDLDKDKLVYTASSLSMPSWLKFASGKFTGTPTYTASENTYSIVVTANDGKGGTITDTFDLTVTNVSTITGTAKAEAITAGLGNDLINGLAGNDTINGGAGDDVIDGGLGSDIVTGGIGADSFKFTSALKGNLDKITDFARGTDKLVLDDAIFTKLAAGELNTNNFASTSETAGALDYLVAKSVQVDSVGSTALYYDADGSGKGAAIQFATLVGVTDLSASDFWIV